MSELALPGFSYVGGPMSVDSFYPWWLRYGLRT